MLKYEESIAVSCAQMVHFSGALQDAASWPARGFPSCHQISPDLLLANSFNVPSPRISSLRMFGVCLKSMS